MEPVIPLIPRTSEGHGSAYILPRQERVSPLDILLSEHQNKLTQHKVAQKQLQDDLIGLDSINGNLLPEHQKELLQKKNDLINWMAEQRKTGGNPYNPNSDSYYETRKKIAELAALAKSGQAAKEHLVRQVNAVTANPDKYDPLSLSDIKSKITSTKLGDLDFNNFGEVETALDPIGYRNKVLQKVQPKVTWSTERPTPMPGGSYMIGGVAKTNPEDITQAILSDDSKTGNRYRDMYYRNFLELPEVDRNKIVDQLALKNSSIKDNPEVLKKAVTKLMVQNSLNGYLEDKALTKTIPNYEFQALLRQQEKAANESPDKLWTKTPVTFGGKGGREAFNKKYRQNYSEEQWKGMGGMNDNEEGKYIAVGARKGMPDSESIQLNIDGKPFKPHGYRVDQNGDIYASGAVTELVNSGKADTFGDPVKIEKYVPVKNIPLSKEDAAGVASHYHFGDVEEFKKWLNSSATTEPNDKNSTKTVRTITRAEWGNLPVSERMKLKAAGVKVK